MRHIMKIKSLSKSESICSASLFIFLILLIQPSVAISFPDDPIPTLDFGESEKSIVVRLQFGDLLEAQMESVKVVPGPSHGWMGDPPLLRVKVLDLDSNVIKEFNAWHPLLSNYQDVSGNDRGFTLEEAPGNFPFPFSPDAATFTLTDVETQQEITSVDLIPSLHNFCRDNPDDPECLEIANRPPICDANGPYSVECAGSSTDVMLDGSGSSDPDGDAITFAWSGPFTGGQATGATPEVEFTGFGQFAVTLDVSDEFGDIATCGAEVAVVDTTPPTIECNAPETIVPPDAPISFNATATDICIGEINASITAFDCFAFTKKGKRIDKTESCVVSVAGDTITILDTGGVDDHITWTIIATDSSGNTTETNCEILVVNPGKN